MFWFVAQNWRVDVIFEQILANLALNLRSEDRSDRLLDEKTGWDASSDSTTICITPTSSSALIILRETAHRFK